MKYVIYCVFILWAGSATADTVDDLKTLGIPEAYARTIVQNWIERYPDQSPTLLVETLQQAAQQDAPVELVLDKASEGVAKGVPSDRLLHVLNDWGKNLGQAARTVRTMRQNLKPGIISEREAILRMSMLQRLNNDNQWIEDLEKEAKKNEIDFQAFLNVGEAIGHLTQQLGLKKKEAEELGVLWMKEKINAGDIGKYVRAIEQSRDQMPIEQATRIVVENILGGRTPDDILRDLQDKQITKDQRNDRSTPSAGTGPDREKETGKPDKEKDNN